MSDTLKVVIVALIIAIIFVIRTALMMPINMKVDSQGAKVCLEGNCSFLNLGDSKAKGDYTVRYLSNDELTTTLMVEVWK